MKKYILLIGFIFTSGCATSQKHNHMSGSIVALDSKTEAHVCLTSTNSIIGDLVDVYEVVCSKEKNEPDLSGISVTKKQTTYSTTCKKIRRGHAKIVENMPDHFSKIISLGNLELKEGFIVETSLSQ